MPKSKPLPVIEINEQFKRALDIMENTGKNCACIVEDDVIETVPLSSRERHYSLNLR